MGIQVKLEAFEGPLDLLLHLIEVNKIDIYDIPIASIADQYIEYVNAMETKDMDVMSDFLVMAATLLNIKSRMLLPVDKSLPPEEQDPRYELVQRLLEYKMCKYMAEELKDRQTDADRVLFKAPDIPDDIADFKEEINLSELIGDLTLNRLQDIFRSVVKKQVDKIDPVRSKFGEIKKEEISLDDKLRYILELGKENEKLSFRKLLESAQTKLNIIVTFLAVLELIKMGVISVTQDNLFDDINICFKKDYNINYDDYDLTEY